MCLEHGIKAADDILRYMLRTDVAKALDPLKARDFTILMNRVAQRVNASMIGEEAKAMSAALDALDVRWQGLSDTGVQKIVDGANAILRKKIVNGLPPKLNGILEVEGPRISERTRESVVKRYGLEIGSDLTSRDRKAEKNVRKLTINYVRDELGDRVETASAKARGIVERGLSKGFSSREIVRDLQRGLGKQVSRGPGYWRIVSNAFTGHARTFSQVAALEEAAFQQWTFEAVLDEVTSDVCRFYHGRVFPMRNASKHIARVTDLEDPEDVSQISPWVQTGSNDDGEEFLYIKRGKRRTRIANVLRSGVGVSDDLGAFAPVRDDASLMRLGIMLPPLHGNCRSTVLPA